VVVGGGGGRERERERERERLGIQGAKHSASHAPGYKLRFTVFVRSSETVSFRMSLALLRCKRERARARARARASQSESERESEREIAILCVYVSGTFDFPASMIHATI